MKCIKCKAELPDGSKFCTECGAILEAPATQENVQNPNTKTAERKNDQQIGSQNYAVPNQPNPNAYTAGAGAFAGGTYNSNMGYGQNAQGNMNYGPNPAYGQPQNFYSPPPVDNRDTTPLSVGQFMLIELLMMIPLVNLILLFVWGFGGGVNVNRKNYALSKLIWLIISTVAAIILTVFLSFVLVPIIVEAIEELQYMF